jgi:predicted esterase
MKNLYAFFFVFFSTLSPNNLFSAEALPDQPLTIFCHGIVDNEHQAKNYPFLDQVQTDALQFSDVELDASWSLSGLISRISSRSGRSPLKPYGKQVNRDQMFMGQTKDIETLTSKVQKHSGKPIVLYGASRGASTIVSYLGQAEKTDTIRAVILESPAADMLDAVSNFSAKLGVPLPTSLFRWIFYRYPEKPYTPLSAINDITCRELPIFILYTREDTTVHPAQAWVLYKAFKEKGFNNVYIHEIQKGRHCHLHLEQDFETSYCAPVKAFYNRYAGGRFSPTAFDVTLAQPSIEQAELKIAEFNNNRAANYAAKIRQNIAIFSTITIVSAFLYYLKRHKTNC